MTIELASDITHGDIIYEGISAFSKLADLETRLAAPENR